MEYDAFCKHTRPFPSVRARATFGGHPVVHMTKATYGNDIHALPPYHPGEKIMATGRKSGESVVHRIVAILTAFNKQDKNLTLTEIQKRADLSPATAHRISQALVATGMLGFDERAKTYHLGITLLHLGDLARSNIPLIKIAEPYVTKLSEEWHEDIVVDILDENFQLLTLLRSNAYSYQPPASFQLKVVPHKTSNGKSFLAYMERDRLKEYCNKYGLTNGERARLEQNLRQTRINGYASNEGELLDDYYSLGVPIRAYTGRVVAAISMTIPTLRNYTAQSKERIVDSLLDASARITRDMT